MKLFWAALVAATAAVPAAAAIGDAKAGLQAMRETNLIVLGNWQAGQDVEGKTFVGGNASGNSSTLGIGRGNQGATPSSRPTLTIGGNNSINGINLNNGSNGGNGPVATSPGVVIVGDSKSISVNAQGASIVVGGNLQGNYNVGAGQTFSVGGNITNGGINIRAAMARSLPDQKGSFVFEIEVKDYSELLKTISAIEQMEEVITVSRA
jgi:hypothetical protein